MNDRVNTLSDKLKALAHPQRLNIVETLAGQSANVSALQANLGIPQPSVSAHLARLRGAGIIRGRRQGQEINYELIDEDTKKLLTLLN